MLGIPGLANSLMSKRTIRAPVNPLDKSTIVSIFPKEINERNHTIQPGVFQIPPGSLDRPSILVVGTSSWWREIDEDQPLLEIPVSSIQVADSVVRDYCIGLIGCNMTDTMPGLFYIPGEWTVERVKKEHQPLIHKYANAQKNWFLEQVKIADILWARSNGNPLSISDDARMACRELNISNKEWLKNYQMSELVRCVACGAMRNPQFPICAQCKAIADPELAKKLNLTFAQ